MSLCRDERVIYVYREQGSSYGLDIAGQLQRQLKAKVGGLFGIGAESLEATISIEKELFEPEEELRIDFEVDNSQCKKDIKSFKVKLLRELAVFEEV